MNPRNQKSMNLTLILWRNRRLIRGDFFENKITKLPKIRTKLNSISILKKLNAKQI